MLKLEENIDNEGGGGSSEGGKQALSNISTFHYNFIFHLNKIKIRTRYMIRKS